MKNDSLEIIKDIYKPYRCTIKGNCKILETSTGNYVVKTKKNDKDLKGMYDYLSSRNFHSFPKLVEHNREDVHVTEYIEELQIPKEQKALDLIQQVSLLHQKTTYFKSVSVDVYQEIYENIDANITYSKAYYDNLFEYTVGKIYMSPSEYFFMTHYSKVKAALDFCKREIDDWFELVKKENKQRVCFIHNQLALDHFLENDQGYLISWENSKTDSPVLDLVHFYKNEYFDLDFEMLLQKYFEKNPFSEAEKKLFFCSISLPPKVELAGNEFLVCKNIREQLDYVFKTELLIRPYYTIQKEN